MTDCKCSSSHEGSGFVSGFALGLVLGAAGAHYLQNTESGQELLASLKDKAEDAMEAVKDNPVIADKIADLQSTMDQARESINQAANQVAQATTNQPTPAKKSFFQKMGASLGK